MKKIAKRLVAMALALMMILSLVACNNQPAQPTGGNDPAPTGGNDPAPGTTAAPTEPALGLLEAYPETVKVSLTMILDQVSAYPEGLNNDNNAYRSYIEEKLNIDVETAFEAKSGEDYARMTSLAIAGEDLPDFLYIYGNGHGSGLALVKELYENDMIMSIDEVYEKYAPERMKKAYDSYGDTIWNGITFDGEKYALPYAAGMYYPMIWVRSDWLKKLNITMDEDGDGIITRDELVMVAKAFIDNDMSGDGKTVGLALDNGIGSSFATLTDSFGAFTTNYMPNDDGTVSHGSTDPKMKEALAWLRDLHEHGILDPQYGTRTGKDISEMLINGQLGIFMGAWSFGSARKAIHEMNPEADFVSFNLDNGNGKVNFPATLVTKDHYYVIRKDCENPEALFKMWETERVYTQDMTAEEKEAEYPLLQEQISAGLTGVARPVWIDILGAQFAFDNQINPVLSYVENGTIIGKFDPENNVYMRSYKTYHEDPTTMKSSDWVIYLSRFAGGAYHAYKLSEAGLYEMYSPIYNQVPSMASNPVDLGGLMTEYYIKIITGELPLDAFDEYVTQRYAQGDDKICKELADAIK